MRSFVLPGVLLGLCASFLAAPSFAADPLTADTPLTTSNGATFTAPVGWRVVSTGGKNVLDPPEADSHLVLVDVKAANPDAAIAAAWSAWRPEAKRPLRVQTAQAPYNGWEDRRIYTYETSPNEKMVVYALTRRAGADWVVVIVEATQATFEKRNVALSLAISSLRPKGYQREMFAGRKAHPLDAGRIAELQEFMRGLMRQFEVPGVGLALIDGGKVVFEGGFGVRALGKPEPVDADTLFIAASNTKAMTTLLLAELVDEKKMRWDQPVTELYPSFRLGDAETTRQVLVKHLVCACIGMPRQDFEWLFNFGSATPLSSLNSLGAMQPTSRFGEVYQYSNLMAAAAGYIGAAVLHPGQELGAAYDEAIRARVFGPLGMTHTTFDFAAALAGNVAAPHDLDIDGKVAVARQDINYSMVPVRPAGGMWTSAHDLAKYLQMEMAEGLLPDGKRLVSRENLLERRKPQVQMSEDLTYGMALVVNTQYGIPIVDHGGSMFGYKSDMIFLPEHGVGVVILTNADSGGYLHGLFRRRLLELLFDGKPEAAEQADAAAKQRHAYRAKWRERLVVPANAAEAAKLAARYTSPALGELRVRREDGATFFDFAKWSSVVSTRRNDDGTLSFVTIDPTVDGFTFVVGEREGRKALVIRDSQHEYAFVEAP